MSTDPRPPLRLDAVGLRSTRLVLSPSGVRVTPSGLALRDVIGLWCDDAVSATLRDKCRDASDLRCIVHVRHTHGPDLGVRICRNPFTTPATVADLEAGERHHATLGVPGPQVVRTRDGAVSATVDGFLCYAETWLPGTTAREAGDRVDRSALRDDVLRLVARSCAASGPVVAARSPWAFIDEFLPGEPDESEECSRDLHAALASALPGDPRPDAWRHAYLAEKTAVRERYLCLPEAYVQGDTNSSNVLVDEEGRLAGLIDFNLAGMERCLTYLFAEVFEAPEALADLTDPAAAHRRDEEMRRRFALAGETYAFSAAERELFPALYRLRMPTFWPVVELLRQLVEQGHAGTVIDHVWGESRRPDAELLGLLPPL